MCIIYGAGYLGLLFCDLMLENHIFPQYILDKDVNKQGIRWDDMVPIVSPGSVDPKDRGKRIIVAHSDYEGVYEEIRQNLLRLGFSNVEHIFDFAQKQENAGIFGNQKMIIRIDRKWLEDSDRNVEKVKEALGDSLSVKIYSQIINALKRGDFGGILSFPLKEQYFAYDVYTKIPEEVFLDVGGGPDGDVLSTFLARNHDVFQQYYYFEPDGNIFDVETRENGNEKIVFVQRAVGEVEKHVFLKNYLNMNSVIQETGSVHAECVRLDDFDFRHRPTFLKIDVEGGEKEVLAGGRNMIKSSRPVIACAIYHRQEDFWEIPMYLMEQLDDYKYYIRSYQNISETILYAVPEERWVK